MAAAAPRSRFLTTALLAVVVVTSGAAAPVSAPPLQPALPFRIDWTLTPAQIASTCRSQIALADKKITALTKLPRGKRTFATVVVPLEAAMADLNDDTAAQQFLSNVSTDKATRDASLRCNTDEGTFASEVTARPALYAALREAKAAGVAGVESKKLTDLWLTASFRSGAGLGEAKRREFVRLSAKLTDVQNRFQANLAEDHSTIALTPAQTAGLAADFAATFKRDGETYVVPVNESTVQPFMQDAADESARKAFYLAYNNRGAANNVALLQQAIALRDRLAHLFGYKTWAAYVLADRMARTPDRVQSFLRDIDTAILPKAKQERDELSALKGTPIEPWDKTYYENQLRKTKYAVDRNAIKQYFPVEHTIDAILAVYAKLLSVRYTRIERPGDWNPEVLAYNVNDAATGTFVGQFYLDLYPRPGKYNHFANFPIVPRRTLRDGSRRAPISVIVGNWARPAAGKPSLLSHDEVETFFHEFGHNMAAMLATGNYETLTGGFRQDFVEAPSQMLENWVWDPGILKEISHNTTTGAPLPDDLIQKMIAARYFHYAYATTIQVLYAVVDMAYHSSGAKVDTTAIWRQTVAALTPGTFVEGTHPQAGFGHLMNGYDAGYYGYLWSKVYAQDMFTAFKAAGLENPEVGMRYRSDILAPAREYEPDVEVAAFLGRPMSPNAFYAELGIAPPKSATLEPAVSAVPAVRGSSGVRAVR